ncbi:MAG TPA: hypothetical protein VFP34_02900 [Microlunatus sp.]|nr:hypothetical protein [Microlunatus sp.]
MDGPSRRRDRVVLGVAGLGSGHAARWAAEEADRRGTFLIITSVESTADGGPNDLKRVQTAAGLERSASVVARHAPSVPLVVQPATGDGTHLVGLTDSAAILVIGDSAESRAINGLGPAAGVRCPVIVVGNIAPHADPVVLVPIGSAGPTSLEAVLSAAADEASMRGWPLVVLDANGDGDGGAFGRRLREQLAEVAGRHPRLSLGIGHRTSAPTPRQPVLSPGLVTVAGRPGVLPPLHALGGAWPPAPPCPVMYVGPLAG